jgi:PAS domain S-box-containing protein
MIPTSITAGNGSSVASESTEKALRESDEKFHQLADNITDVFWIRSPDMREVHYVSPAFEKIWGVPVGTQFDNPQQWIDFIMPEDRERVQRAFLALTRDAATIDVEYRIRRLDGEVRWIRSRGFQVRDADNQLIRLIGIVTDIHDLKLAQLEILRTNRALKMLSSCSAARARAESELQLLNEVCRIAVEHGGYRMAWVGYAQDDDLKSITPIAHAGVEKGFLSEIKVSWDEDEPEGQGPAGQVIRTGSAVVHEDLSHEPKASHWLPTVHRLGYRGTVCLPFRDATRTFGLLVLYNAELKQTSDEELTLLSEMADDVALGIVNLRTQAEARRLETQLMVSDRMASVGTLAAGVAHEINNPLAAVMGNLDYIADSLSRMTTGDVASMSPGMRDAWIREEIKTPLDDAVEAAQRVRFIVRDLKIFSRSPNDAERGPVNVETIMESSLRMAWNEIRHRANLVKRYGHVPAVEGNEARLGQVFLNLVVNAAQSLPPGQAEQNEIRVTTSVEGERVIIEVSDTGAGIPPQIIGRIFDAFFTTKAVGVGTGLGLAICQRIVTDMGGALTVESEMGKGTTFRVSVPIAHKKELEVIAPTVQLPDAGRRGRILVVDDEELVLRSVRRILSQEHDVLAMVSAEEALAVCAGGEKFDLILCDLMMPDMTGMDFHRELSLVSPEQADRMIFITGGAFTEKARAFLSETPKEHLEKPFYSANLRAIVQRYLR